MPGQSEPALGRRCPRQRSVTASRSGATRALPPSGQESTRRPLSPSHGQEGQEGQRLFDSAEPPFPGHSQEDP